VNCYDCEAEGGEWQGAGSTCDPDPCEGECEADEDCTEYPDDTAVCCEGDCRYSSIDPGGCVDADTGICTDGEMFDDCQQANQSNVFYPCGCESIPP
jgi:hypothetical protein